MTAALGVSRFGDAMTTLGRALSGRIAAVSLAALAALAGAVTYAWLAGFVPAAFGTNGWMTGLLVADLVIAVTLVHIDAAPLLLMILGYYLAVLVAECAILFRAFQPLKEL